MNILVIGPSWVGDMMMSHSLYQTLKRQYPQCNIDVLAPNWCKPLLARMPEVRNALTMPIGYGAVNLVERYRTFGANRKPSVSSFLPRSRILSGETLAALSLCQTCRNAD